MEPALNTAELSSTGGSDGATDVQNFANSQTEKMENALATGDTEKLTSVVSTAVSNIADIKVGIHELFREYILCSAAPYTFFFRRT